MIVRGSRSMAVRSGVLLSTLVVSLALGSATSGQSVAPASVVPTDDPSEIRGLFDVDGHGLYLHCRGTGSPTVVYMHGSINDPGVFAHQNGEFVLSALGDEYRACVYDRRNVGSSDTVDAAQLPEDAIAEMRGLLAAAGIGPPYVLLGASFGGLLAYLYANEYPDDVVGMVLLDSMFPDEMALEDLFPASDRYEAFDQEDEQEGLERISHFKVQQAAQPFIGHEPAIPVVYLSSIPEGFDVNDYGVPEYDERIMELQRAYAERFSPGIYERVDSPHFMELSIPALIIEKLRLVIDSAAGATDQLPLASPAPSSPG